MALMGTKTCPKCYTGAVGLLCREHAPPKHCGHCEGTRALCTCVCTICHTALHAELTESELRGALQKANYDYWAVTHPTMGVASNPYKEGIVIVDDPNPEPRGPTDAELFEVAEAIKSPSPTTTVADWLPEAAAAWHVVARQLRGDKPSTQCDCHYQTPDEMVFCILNAGHRGPCHFNFEDRP